MPRLYSDEASNAAPDAGAANDNEGQGDNDSNTARQHRWLAFTVADFGPGIAPEVRQRLFTPFFTTKAEGMGLGLSLCRTVVEQHGGVLFDAPNLPQGTVFTFSLPASGVA